MGENSFDLNDLLEQMKQVKKMGSLSSIVSMLPGAKTKLTDEQEAEGEKQLRRTEAIINSMTKKERAKPSIIDAKRKRRIAAGSGTEVSDVNRLLKQFEQMQKMMKQLSGNGKQGKKMRQMLSQMESKGGFGNGMPF
jgi:signal recognition particle subunit SRP54